MTNMLSCKAVGGAKTFNVVCIVTECMDFVSCHVEALDVWAIFSREYSNACLSALFFCLAGTTVNVGGLLPLEPCCVIL